MRSPSARRSSPAPAIRTMNARASGNASQRPARFTESAVVLLAAKRRTANLLRSLGNRSPARCRPRAIPLRLDVNPLPGDRDHDAFAPWVLSSSERAVFDSSLLRMSQKGPVVPQRRKSMAYQAEISRKNPGCFLFLVDQSESMEDPFGGGEAGRRKAEELATILNKLIHNLCIRCAKSDSIYDYFHVGVLGYSEESCKPALGGELSGRSLVPISELASKPLRIEERVKKSDDGAGGVMDQTVKFPVWFDPYSKGGTPMWPGLKEATKITETW